MPQRRYVYASEMGCLYRLTHRDWRNFCKVRSLQDATLDAFGTYLGGITNVTDWGPQDAQQELCTYYGGK